MWRVVEAKQRPSRRRRGLTASSSAAPIALGSQGPPGPISRATHDDRAQSPAALARDIRRAAAALQAMDFVQHDILAPLHHFVSSYSSCSSSTSFDSCDSSGVHFVALGIGPFAREESRSGFLQMALFIAMRSSLPAAAHSVSASFFDPAASERHCQCCERLAVRAERENHYGAYTPHDGRALLIVFLPHAPWALLRNVFAANAVAGSLSRLLVIGNDVRGAGLQDMGFIAALAPYLQICAVDTDHKNMRGAKDDDSESDEHPRLRGVGRHDVRGAFSDTAVMRLDPSRAEEAAQLRPPPIARSGPEIR